MEASSPASVVDPLGFAEVVILLAEGGEEEEGF